MSKSFGSPRSIWLIRTTGAAYREKFPDDRDKNLFSASLKRWVLQCPYWFRKSQVPTGNLLKFIIQCHWSEWTFNSISPHHDEWLLLSLTDKNLVFLEQLPVGHQLEYKTCEYNHRLGWHILFGQKDRIECEATALQIGCSAKLYLLFLEMKDRRSV